MIILQKYVSKIAAQFACKRTNCTQVIKKAIALDLENTLIERCKKQQFSIFVMRAMIEGLINFLSYLLSVLDFLTCQLLI